MRLSRDELKEISAGATAADYGSFLKALLVKIVAYIHNILNGGTSGGGTVPDDGGGTTPTDPTGSDPGTSTSG